MGAAVLAPKEMQYQAFKQALPVLEAVKHLKKIVIAPLPRYWESTCCANKRHVSNFRDEDYNSCLETNIYECKNNLRAFCFRHGVRDVRVIGGWHCVKKERNLWADCVHLSDTGYDIIAATVAETVGEMKGKRPAEQEAGARSKKPRMHSPPGERRRTDERQGQPGGSGTRARMYSRGDYDRGDPEHSGSSRAVAQDGYESRAGRHPGYNRREGSTGYDRHRRSNFGKN